MCVGCVSHYQETYTSIKFGPSKNKFQDRTIAWKSQLGITYAALLPNYFISSCRFSTRSTEGNEYSSTRMVLKQTNKFTKAYLQSELNPQSVYKVYFNQLLRSIPSFLSWFYWSRRESTAEDRLADTQQHDEEDPVVRRNTKLPLVRNSLLLTLNISFSLNLDRYSSASICCLFLPAIYFHCCMFVSNHSNHRRLVAQKLDLGKVGWAIKFFHTCVRSKELVTGER